MILAILSVREFIEGSNLVEIVLDVLYDTRCSILDQVVHGREGLEDAAVVFGFGLKFGP